MSGSPEPPSADAGRSRVIGSEYVETIELRDGTSARLRPIHPDDKERLSQGLSELSAQSRYLRFFTDKERLNEAELRYLTEVDGEDHFALAICRLDEQGEEQQGLGIGRFVRLADEPHVAEPALAVLDDAQGQGLGRLLLLRLIAAAAERDVQVFRCDFLAINQGMQELLRDVSNDVEFRSDGPVVTAQFRLPSVPADASPGSIERAEPMFACLRLAAEQVMQLRRLVENRGEQFLGRWRALHRQLRGARRGRDPGAVESAKSS